MIASLITRRFAADVSVVGLRVEVYGMLGHAVGLYIAGVIVSPSVTPDPFHTVDYDGMEITQLRVGANFAFAWGYPTKTNILNTRMRTCCSAQKLREWLSYYHPIVSYFPAFCWTIC